MLNPFRPSIEPHRRRLTGLLAAALLLVVHWLAATAPLPPTLSFASADAGAIVRTATPATWHIVPDAPAEIARATAAAPTLTVTTSPAAPAAGSPDLPRPPGRHVVATVAAKAVAGLRQAGPRARAPPLSV